MPSLVTDWHAKTQRALRALESAQKQRDKAQALVDQRMEEFRQVCRDKAAAAEVRQ